MWNTAIVIRIGIASTVNLYFHVRLEFGIFDGNIFQNAAVFNTTLSWPEWHKQQSEAAEDVKYFAYRMFCYANSANLFEAPPCAWCHRLEAAEEEE